DELILADRLLGQASQLLEANEMLLLLDKLRPVYERQPAYLQQMKAWLNQRVTYLRAAGQTEQALGLQKQLATGFPRDHALQVAYARALAEVGEYAAAYAWIDRVLTKDARWLPEEENALRSQYADMKEGQGRFADLVGYLESWTTRNPEQSSPYARYLSALIRNGQADKANTLVALWLKEGQVDGEPAAAVAARLDAAIDLALGQAHNLSLDRTDQRWWKPLSEAALFFARHEPQLARANKIIAEWRFRQTDACVQVRKALAGILAADIDTLAARQVVQFIYWVEQDGSLVERDTWKRIADGLRKRWLADKDPQAKRELDTALVHVLTNHGTVAERLDFLRL